MKLTVFAATGGIGRHLLLQSLAAGHDVAAVVRRAEGLDRRARVFRADLARPDPGSLVEAVTGADAVLSALGRRSAADAGIATEGTRAIVRAMQTAGVRRLVVVSAAPVGTVALPGRPLPPTYDPGDGFFMRHLMAPIVKALLREVYADLASMEELLRESDLDWTVIRPPRLHNGDLTRTYRKAYGQNVRGGASIGRADVAHLMLDVLQHPESIRQTVGIAS